MEEPLAAKAQEETDEVRRALAAYSRARSGAASYAIMAGRETLRMYATAGVDWERLSEDELASLVDLPMMCTVPFPTREEEEERRQPPAV